MSIIWYNEIRNSRAFALGKSGDPGAGNFMEIQLFNPPGSNKTVIVRRVLVAPVTVDLIHMRISNTALGTLVGTGVNLNSGQSAGIAEVRTATPNTFDGTAIFRSIRVPAQTTFPFVDLWGMQLGAGKGMIVVPSTAGTVFTATFEWIEI